MKRAMLFLMLVFLGIPSFVSAQDKKRSREDLEFMIEMQEPPSFVWDREVEGLGAVYDSLGRSLLQAELIYSQIPARKYPDLEARQRQVVRDNARAYAVGIWSAAERSFLGEVEGVPNSRDLKKTIELMLKYGVTPPDIGLTTARMRVLVVTIASREIRTHLEEVRVELARPQPICGAVDEALVIAKRNSSGWVLISEVAQLILQYDIEPNSLGFTVQEAEDVMNIGGSIGSCIVRPELARKLRKGQ